jgi:hypothetical protein
MDGATVPIIGRAAGFVLVVMFLVFEARRHAGKKRNNDFNNPSGSRRR